MEICDDKVLVNKVNDPYPTQPSRHARLFKFVWRIKQAEAKHTT